MLLLYSLPMGTCTWILYWHDYCGWLWPIGRCALTPAGAICVQGESRGQFGGLRPGWDQDLVGVGPKGSGAGYVFVKRRHLTCDRREEANFQLWGS